MKDKYFVIEVTVDGTYVFELTHEQLIEGLNTSPDDDDGLPCILDGSKAIDKLPSTYLEHCHENQFVIIKGQIVVPRAVNVVKEYEI